MTSTMSERICTQCNKDRAIVICAGCQQVFCVVDIAKHRQELAQQMDLIGQEHDIFLKDLICDNGPHPLLSHIDTWEQKAISIIQIAAATARINLRQCIERAKSEAKIVLDKMTDELQANCRSDNYTEIDLNKWTEQLNELRRRLEATSTIEIVNDDETPSSIGLIQIRDTQQPFIRASKERSDASQKSVPAVRERFYQAFGPITLSENGLLAKHSGDHRIYSSICGVNTYSSEKHAIRFRIEHKTSAYMFFGIIPSSQEKTPEVHYFQSAYGWGELDYTVVDGKQRGIGKGKIIRTGDDVTLSLDCDNQQLLFEHHRTKSLVYLSVDLQKCPLPWKIIVVLHSPGDLVRILNEE